MIGIFDSGSGGLTVLRALRERAPTCDVVYFADLLHMPYGNKTKEEICSLTLEAVEFLKNNGTTEIISACNSVSAQILSGLSKELRDSGVRIIETITPTVTALSKNKKKKILLVATQATVLSNVYKNAFSREDIHIEQVALPPLAEAIERNAQEEEIQTIFGMYLSKALAYNPDIVILGCTQYPLAKESFERFFAQNAMRPAFFDPAYAVAEEVVKQFAVEGRGELRVFTSKESPDLFRRIENIFPNTGKHSMVVEQYGKNH